MSLTNRVGLLAGTAVFALAGVGFAGTGDTNSEALAEIAKLKAELAELKAQQGDNWLTEQRSAEIRSLVQDVLADADTRASLQSTGMTAGWDKGFFLASPDGNFRLRIKGQIQFRYVLNYRDLPSNVTDQGQDRWTKGFENRRTKLTFEGNIFDQTWLYKVQAAFNRGNLDDAGVQQEDSGAAQLQDAWIQKDFENGLYLRFGQYKPPFLREELVNSARQLAVERSLVNERYNQDYSQGVSLGFESDMFRVEGMFSDGIGDTGNVWGRSFQNSPWQETTTEYAFTARAEFLAAGEWKQFDDFTSWNGEPFGLMIGAAVNWQRAEFGTNDPLGPFGQQLGATVDASVEFGGANLYGAFVWANPDLDGEGTAGGDRDELAFIVQGGFMLVPDTFEIFGRYEWADPDTGENDLNLLTAGVNWYFAKNAAKFTADVGFSLEDFDSSYANSGAGWLVGFNETQIVLRAQFQLLF